jgi:RNA polymerase sigma factor (sigma-70 family)
MLGSVQDAEDMVQETFLRAWRARAGFQGRSLFRTWLYRIATNASLNALERRQRRVLPPDLAPATADPRLPARRLDWTSATRPTEEEQAVLRRFMEAFERQDAAAMTAMLREDARQAMPPAPLWFDGREALRAVFEHLFGPGSPGRSGWWPPPPTASRRRPATSGRTARPSSG